MYEGPLTFGGRKKKKRGVFVQCQLGHELFSYKSIRRSLDKWILGYFLKFGVGGGGSAPLPQPCWGEHQLAVYLTVDPCPYPPPPPPHPHPLPGSRLVVPMLKIRRTKIILCNRLPTDVSHTTWGFAIVSSTKRSACYCATRHAYI